MTKAAISLFILMCSLNLSFGQKNGSDHRSKLKLLEKVVGVDGEHIRVANFSDKQDTIILDIEDDRKVMRELKFTKEMKIQVLKELLSFQEDTAKSNKYYFMKVKKPKTNKFSYELVIPRDKCFTIEIEALFSFTWYFTRYVPPIQPTLLDRRTGEPINCNRKKVNEVYAIYRRWLKKYKSKNFVDFKLPLEGTPYGWLGDDVDLSSHRIATF